MFCYLFKHSIQRNFFVIFLKLLLEGCLGSKFLARYAIFKIRFWDILMHLKFCSLSNIFVFLRWTLILKTASMQKMSWNHRTKLLRYVIFSNSYTKLCTGLKDWTMMPRKTHKDIKLWQNKEITSCEVNLTSASPCPC